MKLIFGSTRLSWVVLSTHNLSQSIDLPKTVNTSLCTYANILKLFIYHNLHSEKVTGSETIALFQDPIITLLCLLTGLHIQLIISMQYSNYDKQCILSADTLDHTVRTNLSSCQIFAGQVQTSLLVVPWLVHLQHC